LSLFIHSFIHSSIHSFIHSSIHSFKLSFTHKNKNMSTMSSFDLTMVWSLLGLLIQLVVFGFCVYYVVQKQNTDSFLLAIGSFVHLVTSLFYTVGLPILTRMSVDVYSNRSIFSVIGFINLIGTICFSAGLILLIVNYIKVVNNKEITY
jgi:hypothetical protein